MMRLPRQTAERLTYAPLTIKEATAFVRDHHRHSAARTSGRFALQAKVGDTTVGVALAGRPVSRHLDDGHTLEVLRVCTDGTANACSFLYGAVRRVARSMGYRKLITYTLESEPGSSLRAAGFHATATVKADHGDRPARPRVKRDAVPRVRWEREL